MVPFSRLRGATAALCACALVVLSPFSVAQQASCKLFASDAVNGNLLLFKAFALTTTTIGNMGIAVPSLAADPATGLLYAGEGQGQSNLHLIDTVTGASSLIGSTGLGIATISGMEFAPNGMLFASINLLGNGGTGSDHLATLDKTTGAATIIGPFGSCAGSSCTIEGLEGIAFDDQGVLYAVKRVRGTAGLPGLYTIDTSTGAATFDKPLVDVLGASPSGGFVSLQYCDCDGNWYAGTAKAIGMATDGGMLAQVDIVTGIYSYLVPNSLTGGSSLGGLARLHVQAASTTRNGTGVNPVVYSQISPPIVGQIWQLQIDLAPSGALASVVSAVATGPFSFPTTFGELLIDISGPFVGMNVAIGNHAIVLPPGCGLVGLTMYTQGATISSGSIRFTNAIDVTFGSF